MAASQRDADDCMAADPERSIAGCTRLLQERSLAARHRVAAYQNRGVSWYQKGDYDRAIADYNEAIRLDPKRAGTYNDRSAAWHGKGDNDRAIADLNEAIRLNPKYAVAYNNRCVVWRDKGDYDRAIADCNEAIRLNPKYADAYRDRGVAWREKGDYDHAIADYNEAIRLNPKYADAYRNRAAVWSDKGDNDRAIADLNEAIRLDPKSADAYYNRGNAYRAKREYESAIADYDRAAAIDPKYANSDARSVALTELAKLQQSANALPSYTGTRVALVVGNSTYASVSPLSNPGRDADAVAAALRRIGFQIVHLESNLVRDKLINALRSFAAEAEKADWALVYFAGHGIEVAGVNYLIPVDARLATDRDISFEAVPLDQIMNAVEGAKKLRLVLLDACRDNPFLAQMRRTMASRSISRGLGRIEPEAGTLVVYAAKHGEIALDGTAENSPFASAFVSRLATPGLEVRRLFDFVRDDVLAATNRRQQPFSYGSLPAGEDFFFVK
jgi:tetratricopeptide (TPR) repeat protein